jgi:hypothetical protein
MKVGRSISVRVFVGNDPPAGPVRALLKYAFNYPPLATSLETAGMFTVHMVLGRGGTLIHLSARPLVSST